MEDNLLARFAQALASAPAPGLVVRLWDPSTQLRFRRKGKRAAA